MSAQISATFEQTHGSIANLIASGEEDKLQAWLDSYVWPLGRSVNGEELVERVCGQPLSAQPFLTYLETKVEQLLTST